MTYYKMPPDELPDAPKPKTPKPLDLEALYHRYPTIGKVLAEADSKPAYQQLTEALIKAVEASRFLLDSLRENELFCNIDEWPEGAPPSVQEMEQTLNQIDPIYKALEEK